MFEIDLFGEKIKLKDHYCQLDNYEPLAIETPYINLYTTMTNLCNANCPFCCNEINQKEIYEFDFDKFKKVMQEITSKVFLRKASLTGGEPTTYPENVRRVLECIKENNEQTFTVINTNGSNLDILNDCRSMLDSIAISRHHYDDDINRKLFCNRSVPSSDALQDFAKGGNLHLSCNLIKDYIGTEEEVIKYLEWCSRIKCLDVGFVTLMQTNEYCREHFVDFGNLNFDKNQLFITKNWNFNNLCRCRNYAYIAENLEIVSVYARYYISREYTGSSLVYDGKYLRLGFNGKILY